MSIIEKVITKPKLHQIKPKQNNITYTSLRKNAGPVLNATC